ncbi:MAG: hypothetical protein U0324_29785 [Polyangiales bacterium]
MITVAVVGGGVYAPVLCEALARALGDVSVRLSARDPGRLAAIAREADARAKAAHPGASVTAASSLEEAADGVDHVVLLVRVGGLAARAHDEAFPREFGLVGDEGLGAGGVANAWRTVPALAAMAATLRARCPTAPVWNLVAPLGATTRCLLDAGLGAVGVCELPLVTRERWAAPAGDFGYAGLNHLGWFWPRTIAAQAALERARDVDGPTLRAFGAAPLRYYYELFAPDAAARLGVVRAAGRAEALAAMAEDALTAFREGPGGWTPSRATPWFDRALVPMIAAREGRGRWDGFVDVADPGGCGFDAGATVVEVAASVDAAGVHVRPDADAPEAVARWLTAAARAEALSYEAARGRDGRLLREALRAMHDAPGRDAVEAMAARIERWREPARQGDA